MYRAKTCPKKLSLPELTDSRIAITGATSGIGRALALQLAGLGCHQLWLAGRSSEKMKEVIELCEGAYTSFQTQSEQEGAQASNCADKKFSCATYLGALSSFKGISEARLSMMDFQPNIVIHCAGFTQYAFFADRSLESIESEVRCLLDSTIEFAWHFINQQHQLLEQVQVEKLSHDVKSNSVAAAPPREIDHSLQRLHSNCQSLLPRRFLTVSSALAYLPSPAMAIYGATKSAINSLMASLDGENSSLGLRFMASCPGPVLTQFQERASHGIYRHTDPTAITAQHAAASIIKQLRGEQTFHSPGFMGKGARILGRYFPWSWSSPWLIKRVKQRIASKQN